MTLQKIELQTTQKQKTPKEPLLGGQEVWKKGTWKDKGSVENASGLYWSDLEKA